MKSVLVNTAQPYEIIAERGVLQRAGELTKRVHAPCRVAILTDNVVSELYGNVVARSYEQAGFEVSCFAFEHGERSKRLSTDRKSVV